MKRKERIPALQFTVLVRHPFSMQADTHSLGSSSSDVAKFGIHHCAFEMSTLRSSAVDQ